jgi:hypothetical protein
VCADVEDVEEGEVTLFLALLGVASFSESVASDSALTAGVPVTKNVVVRKEQPHFHDIIKRSCCDML